MSQLIDEFKNIYANDKATRNADLGKLYDQSAVFVDPIHQIDGIQNLKSYIDQMYANVIDCQFVYLGEWVSDSDAIVKWDMKFRHKKLAGGKQIVVRGASHIVFSEKITYHEDIYDMGAMIYEHVPMLGKTIHWLKNRLFKGSLI